MYKAGQDLFGVPHTSYPELDVTKKEVQLLEVLSKLFKDVTQKESEWNAIPWFSVPSQIEEMVKDADAFTLRCKRMPASVSSRRGLAYAVYSPLSCTHTSIAAQLRNWPTFAHIRGRIEDLCAVLPLISELCKPSLRDRHWFAFQSVTKCPFNPKDVESKLGTLLTAGLAAFGADIEDIVDAADKELQLETKLEEIRHRWMEETFRFGDWRGKPSHIILGVPQILEDLEEVRVRVAYCVACVKSRFSLLRALAVTNRTPVHDVHEARVNLFE